MLVSMAGLLALVGGNATMAAAGQPASQVVRAGAKAIGHSSKPKTSALVSLHSSQSTGVVTPTPAVYLVFWGSQWSNDPAGAAGALQNLFGNLYGSHDTWGTILDEYCEGMPVGTVTCAPGATYVQHPSAPLLQKVWLDNGSPAPSKASASQIAAEAVSAAAHFGNTTQLPNLNAQYVIASPSGTHPDGFPHGFCAWHSSTSSKYGNIAYTNLPYVPDLGAGACTTIAPARLLDGYESTETHEYAETVTDPFPSSGWLKGGAEIGDLCENQDAYLTLGGVTFDVQGLWSNAADGCVTSTSSG
jgi:serine protease